MEILGGKLVPNELNLNAKGGTELIAERMVSSINPALLEKFQIIHSRVRQLDPSKIRILVCHDLWNDPESAHLANGGWNHFHKIVFVSHWQREGFIRQFGIPYGRTVVVHNAIKSVELLDNDKPTDKVNLIYHTTPHRGLNIVVPVVAKLAETNPKIHLDVFSSFEMYGWKDRDVPFQSIFDQVIEHPQMTYHGFKPNDEVRECLNKAHIFAYPSVWPETSCMALMEAMASKCLCVHSDLAALPETAANWTMMYNFDQDVNAHANVFHDVLKAAIGLIEEDNSGCNLKLNGAKSYADLFYNWDIRVAQWEALLQSLSNLSPQTNQSQQKFVYQVD